MSAEQKYNGVTMEFCRNIVQNFRNEYKRLHSAECTLTDVQIAECWIAEEEEWTLEAMHELQNEDAGCPCGTKQGGYCLDVNGYQLKAPHKDCPYWETRAGMFVEKTGTEIEDFLGEEA